MARPRQPVDVLIANGRKHLSQAEIEKRRAEEVKPAAPVKIKIPKFVREPLRKQFRAYARQLIDLGIYSELDAETLGRYIVAQDSWAQVEKILSAYLCSASAVNLAKTIQEWSQIQDRYYKQATAAARELGLTISSRCRLVVPKAEEAEDEDDLFG